MPNCEIESNFRQADRVSESTSRSLLADAQNSGPAPEKSSMPDTAEAHLPAFSISDGGINDHDRPSGEGHHGRGGGRSHHGHGGHQHHHVDSTAPTDTAAPSIATDATAPPIATDTAAPPTATDATAPPTATDTTPPPTASANPPLDTSLVTAGSGGNFSVTPQGFVDNQGQSWNMAGLNAGVSDALNGFGNMKSDFPGLTAIRLNVNPGQDSPAQVDQVIQEYTKAGIVVEAEDHSGNGDNVAWYTQMAQTYKDNPLVMLETPNEPNADTQTVASNQIDIINAIRSNGFNNPIGIQPVGGYDQSNIPIVTAAVGTNNEYVTPHIYYSGTDPNGAMSYAQSEVSGANAKGLYAAIDEFGNALDGYTLDPQGQSVIDSVVQLNQQGYNGEKNVGAIFWAADNGNHPDGTDSAFATPDGSTLTPVGQNLSQGWLGNA